MSKKPAKVIKIRFLHKQEYCNVKIIIKLKNRLKRQKLYPSPHIVEASFIENLKIQHGNKVITEFDGSPWFSTNPFYAFNIEAYPEGTELIISWKMNTGETGSEVVQIEYYIPPASAAQ